jgi:ribosomal protein S12 methylthiotransferase accessory factor
MAISRPVGLNLRDVDYTDPLTTIKMGSRLVSSKVGIIRAIGTGISRAQDPVSLALGALAPDLANVSDIMNANKAGGGGEDIETALASTIGEAVERYCMLFYDRAEMVYGSYREIGDDAVHPDLMRLYSREQVERRGPDVKLAYFDEDSKIYWAWGHSLTTGKPRLVPASQVYMEYHWEEDEAPIGRNASSGLAAGTTLEEAILTGLFEVVERDAYTVCWLHRKVRGRINFDDVELQHTLKNSFHYGHPKVDIQIYDITLDIPIPSIFGAMRRPTEFGPVLCVSSVTRLRPRDAIRKCLREIGQGLSYLRFLKHQLRDWEPEPDFSNLAVFDHHCTTYTKRPELVAPAMAPFDAVTKEINFSEIPDRSTGRVLSDIELSVEMLKQAGYEVIVCDITSPDIRDVGLHVVRVLIPGLVPLHGNHVYQYHGVKRLHDIPRIMGWDQEDGWDPKAGFNPMPHPFP